MKTRRVGLLLLLAVTAAVLIQRGIVHLRERSGPMSGAGAGLAATLALEMGAARIVDAIAGVFSRHFRLADVAAENVRLERENQRLRAELLRAGDLAERAAGLERMLGFRQTAGGALVGARVIGRGAAGAGHTLDIDAGRAAGVSEGMPVMSDEGLVGKVTAATALGAVVTLLTDPSIGVDVRRAGDGVRGLLQGTGSPVELTCVFDYVPGGVPAAAGERLLTSGLDLRYPPGIPVGSVIGSRVSVEGIREHLVVPAVRLWRLERLFVVTDRP